MLMAIPEFLHQRRALHATCAAADRGIPRASSLRYIVVGRPIRNAGDRDARRAAAQRIIDEIAG